MKAPLILEYNGSEVWVARHWGNQLRYETLARSAEEVCLRHAHLIVTVSEPLKRDLIDRGIPPSRIVFHPNGVDTDIFDPERFSIIDNQALLSQYGIEEDEIVIGFVGTFGRWHGADILAKSLVHLSQHYHQWLKISNLRLLFIGDGLMRKEVEEILRSEHYAPFTVMTGLVGQDKAAHYMAICDVLVSPHVPNNDQSPFFGSPTKLFEYLASGKPIIASNLDQIGDVLKGCPTVKELRNSHRTLQDDDSAILTEPGSVEDLADAIRYAVDNPLWRTNAGIAARDLALSKYTWEKHVGHLLPFFTDTKDDHSK